MNHFSGRNLAITLAVCLGLVAAVGVACLLVGSTGNSWPHGEVLRIRLESVFDAALIGAALAAAGVAYQAILRNPLADPYLLGASSGAMLATYIWQLPIFAAAAGTIGAAFSQQAFAFFCAAGSVLISLGLASRRGRLDKITLLLVGVIVNAVNGSIFLLINALVDPRGNTSPISFLVGGIHSIGTDQRVAAIGLVVVGWVILLYFTGQLNVAALDDAEAASLGVGLNRLRWITISAASLITAAAVAISGPIGFVGLICPHLARLIFGTDQRRLLPAATAIGAILLMIADAACRYLAQSSRLGTELQVGVLTGLLGGPFFLILLFQSRRSEE